jgi:adenine-specific DNA-methyltransferase
MGYRYIGSKVKIIDIVIDKISTLAPKGAHVTDLMTGTATVAVELRKKGYNVTANDLMTYSYHHAVTGLQFQQEPKFESAKKFIKNSDTDSNKSTYVRLLQALAKSKPIKGYFWQEFSKEGKPKNTDNPRNYFSANNAKIIDGIRYNINKLYSESNISPKEYSLIIHDLIMAVNDVANIAGTYGHHMAKLTGRANDTIKLKPTELLLLDDKGRHTVLKGYAEELSKKIVCDVCYIDPPYMKRQYAANYHVLETVARGDEPEAIGVSGLRPWRDQYSNFCTKTKIRQSFREIFQNMKCNDFLISYSEDGLLSMEDFLELLKPIGDVQITEFDHKRFKSNNSNLKNQLKEYLIHLNKS